MGDPDTCSWQDCLAPALVFGRCESSTCSSSEMPPSARVVPCSEQPFGCSGQRPLGGDHGNAIRGGGPLRVAVIFDDREASDDSP